MNEDILDAIIAVVCVLYVVVRVFKAVWSSVKEKRQLSELGMYAIVEAEKQKWKDELGDQAVEG